MSRFPAIPVAEKVDRATFEHEIKPGNRPVVLKGLVAGWPIVAAAQESPAALGAYLARFDTGRPAKVAICPASQKGRFFYNDTVSGMNYRNIPGTVTQVVNRLLAADSLGDSIYVQAIQADQYLPDLIRHLPMPLLDEDIHPRLWIGNSVLTQTHFDESVNIACHVAGDKVFTLFPPEQVANLYPGPLDLTPAGVPISMVDLDAPDFERFPKFHKALGHAQEARLEPGDALFIPALWWHHVRTTGPLNLLVNYWWNEVPAAAYSPFSTLYLAALSLKRVPADQRQAWRDLVNYFIFDEGGEPMGHLPDVPSVFQHDLTTEQMETYKRYFRENIKL